MKKRKLDASRSRGVGSNEGRYVVDLSNGEVIQPARVEAECFPKKSKHTDVTLQSEDQTMKIDHSEEATNQKIKWKRLITSILELNPDGVVKIRKLQKLVSKSLEDSGITLDDAQLRDRLKHKINSSSQFILGKKFVRLAPKCRSWFPNVNKSNFWQKKLEARE